MTPRRLATQARALVLVLAATVDVVQHRVRSRIASLKRERWAC